MIVTCLNCSKEFDKNKYDAKASPNHFCSKSCAARFNNKKSIKRILTKKCKCCDTLIQKARTYCKICFIQTQTNNDNKTIADLIYTRGHRSNAFGAIRGRARSVASKLGWNSCKKCSYNKHIEIGHIKPINSFSPDTLISVVNSPDNLIPLCPNCHWEHDNL